MPNAGYSISGALSQTLPSAYGGNAAVQQAKESETPADSSSLLEVRLEAASERFNQYDTSGKGFIEPLQLAKGWLSAAAEVASRDLDKQETLMLATAVERTFHELSILSSTKISREEWLHRCLLDAHPPGAAAVEAIAAKARHWDENVGGFSEDWENIDTNCTGRLFEDEVTKSVPSKGLSDVAQMDLTDLLEECGSHGVTYTDFCAKRLGLVWMDVELHFYDLSKHFADTLSPLLLGYHEEGIWHTSVVAFGQEYYYYGQICIDKPGKSCFGAPTRTLKVGKTLRSEEDLLTLCESLEPQFQPELYDPLEHNCNDLSDKLVYFLLGRHVPNSVRLMSDRLRRSAVVSALAPILTGLLGGKASEGGQDAVKKSVSVRSRESFSEDVLLVDIPESPMPVVARFLEMHEDETCDIIWLDSHGRFRTLAGICQRDIRPYRAIVDSERLEFREELLCDLGRKKKPSLNRLSSTVTELQGSEAGQWDVTVCPSGHLLQSMQYKHFWEGHREHHACELCGRAIARGDSRMRCKECNYHICQRCWDRHQKAAAARRPSFMSTFANSYECPKVKGHALERLTGQALKDIDTTCAGCQKQELGCTTAYFYCCRSCRYVACPACVEEVQDRRSSKATT
eukprot:TRINITY_DN28257_c0_g1_i1.p1 TRINITY_DN28257_c0_g1~~TRINITY_DN28257_c0_g1_i1.p1  ORF type:complete len:628 (-),score=76.22 TRINITY_DN28257_c0_g1_i1:472-2355(-)